MKELFSLLRFLFWQEPTREILNNFLQTGADPENDEGAGDLDRGLSLMHGAVQKNRNRLDEFQEELALEFARLFIGPRNPPAVPFASFYLSETKQLMGEVALAVRKIYLDAGMAAVRLHSTPDDHIATELEFLAWLADQEAAASKQGEMERARKMQEIGQAFMAGQVRPWAGLFAEKIINHTNQDFYRGLALVLKGIAAEA